MVLVIRRRPAAPTCGAGRRAGPRAGARAAPAGLDYDFSGRGDGTAVLDLFLRVLKLDAYDELPFASVTIDAGLDCGKLSSPS